MKTIRNIIVLTIAVFTFFSCDNPLALGPKLDLDGPLIDFTSPSPRTAVTGIFDLQGTASDYSGVETMIVRMEKMGIDRLEMPRQWRYNNGAWEISNDYGANWQSFPDAEWNGNAKSASWSIPVEMADALDDLLDGEYLFIAQAWDTGGVSDDNSFKTLVLIIDKDPPQVSVSNPYLYSRWIQYDDDVFDDPGLQSLHELADDEEGWKNSELIGKFQTRSFLLQWNIEDNHNLRSFDLRFYPMDVEIDEDPGTPLPSEQDYIYRYSQNVPPPPALPNPGIYVLPNGSAQVPDLAGDAGDYGVNGYLYKSISEKTTIRVVALCYDAANNPTQEKTIGFFIYWPKADYPWIEYSGGLETAEYYEEQRNQNSSLLSFDEYLDANAVMVYPGRNIKANAYHAQGVKEIKYSLYSYDAGSSLAASSKTLLAEYTDKILENEPRNNNIYSTNFPWEFAPRPRSGFYIVEARAYSIDGIEGEPKESDLYEAVFRVQDITFPDFPVPVHPPQGEPLFKFIDVEDGTLTISGIVSDATAVDSLCLVWINPQSEGYATMSQLEYYRDSHYAGWELAKGLEEDGPSGNHTYEGASVPNKVWKLKLEQIDDDPETGRTQFAYSKTISLSTLNIGIGNQYLRSQVFLLRAENPSNRTTIITYAPQGDTSVPTIKIERVEVRQPGGSTTVCEPGQYTLIPLFQGGETIVIQGSWVEDSSTHLPVEQYLYPNMQFFINETEITGTTITNTTITKNPNTGTSVTRTGTFTVTAVAGTGTSAVQTSVMKDALVVSAKIRDFGGNPGEDLASWLIESDKLRFLRISSEKQDGPYKAYDDIEIFLEFSKPVRLTAGTNTYPQLNLNVSGGVANSRIATYNKGQLTENTRQYFTYTVQPGHTTSGGWLDVTGLTDGETGWNDDDYLYSWENYGSFGTREEVRLTTTNHSESDGNSIYHQTLPSGTANQFSLISGKNIEIDTTPLSVTIAGTQGWHNLSQGTITINATFNKPVKIEPTDPPYLVLATGGSSPDNRTSTSDVRVNGNIITFIYTIKQGDASSGTNNQLVVSSFGGKIFDIPGAEFSPGTNYLLTGVYIDTTTPGVPTVNIRYNNATISNTITTPGNTPPTATVTGTSNSPADNAGLGPWNPNAPPSGNDINNLGTVYLYPLQLQIVNNGTGDLNLYRIEYSTNYGKDWQEYPTNGNADTAKNLEVNGTYEITARQIDRAGNVSNWSKPVVFNWDKGTLVSRIDSFKPNGTYTNNNRPSDDTNKRSDTIDITVYLRKPVVFTTSQPYITLNTGSATNVSAFNYTLGTSVSQLTFNYVVADGHNTGTNKLNVTSFGNITAQDAQGVNVSGLITLPTENNLADKKEIYIRTGPLEIVTVPATSAPAFATTGTGVGVNDDNTYNTRLTATFSQTLARGAGQIEIIQTAASYRLPTVLTEAERNRYRSLVGDELFDKFYTRGTNGLTGTTVDTSPKYILNYAEDPASVDITGTITTDIQKLAEAFRQAEKLTFDANAQAITLTSTQLTVNLSGTNALRVPGGTYTVTIPKGFVQDELGNITTDDDTRSLTAGGIARPFIRVRKAQETITVNTGTVTNTPRVVAVQPFQTTVKIDTRTPNSSIRYNSTNNTTNVENGAVGNPNTGTTQNPVSNTNNWYDSPPTTNGLPSTPGTPAYNNGTGHNNNAVITIGTANSYQGYIWRVLARAFVGQNGSTNSEDVAFRTVFTYQINSMGAPNAGEQRMQVGDQVWLRGGDAISSSSIPGYPLTWEDDWSLLQSEGKRAGIRVMTQISATSTETNSGAITDAVWKWVSWEVNVDTYFDIIMGRRETTDTETAAVVQQYGPKQWAYQRAGWTSYKQSYRLIPGNHRWVVTDHPYNLINYNMGGKGAVNFSGTFSVRPSYTAATWTQP